VVQIQRGFDGIGARHSGNLVFPLAFWSIGSSATHGSCQGYIVDFCKRHDSGNQLWPRDLAPQHMLSSNTYTIKSWTTNWGRKPSKRPTFTKTTHSEVHTRSRGSRMHFGVFGIYRYTIYTSVSQASEDNFQIFRSSFHILLSVIQGSRCQPDNVWFPIVTNDSPLLQANKRFVHYTSPLWQK